MEWERGGLDDLPLLNWGLRERRGGTEEERWVLYS